MENNDSVCYINKISKISPIEGADKIELAQVNGWTSIVQKGIHKEGDLVLCIITDAIIPQDLADRWGVAQYLRKGNRVRTVKLKGVYSECVLIPQFDLFKSDAKSSNRAIINEGKDMMSFLGIFKYEEPVREVVLAGGKRVKQRDNPHFNKYYKFPNIKNVPNIFNENDLVIATRKIHGTNARYGIVKKAKISLLDRVKKFFGNKYAYYEYVYGSHNVIKGSDSNGFYSVDVWADIAKRYHIKEKLWSVFQSNHLTGGVEGIIIYGEIYGPGIQGEKYTYGEKEHSLALFDIEVNGSYVDRHTFEDYALRQLDLPITEVLYDGFYDESVIEGYVNNQYIKDTRIPHEGIVISHVSGDRHKIAKKINPQYLIYAEKEEVTDFH